MGRSCSIMQIHNMFPINLKPNLTGKLNSCRWFAGKSKYSHTISIPQMPWAGNMES